MQQFVMEAATISAMGGVLGIALGYLLSAAGTSIIAGTTSTTNMKLLKVKDDTPISLTAGTPVALGILSVTVPAEANGNKFKLWKNGSADGRRIDIPDTDWHHYAWTCDGTIVRGYRDGAQVMTGEALAFNAADRSNWRIALTGTIGTPNYENFIGDIDEFRLEGEPRSADWIRACYQTQFARRGNVTRLTPPAFGTDVKAMANTAGTITFSADLVCRVPSTLTIHYGQPTAAPTFRLGQVRLRSVRSQMAA